MTLLNQLGVITMHKTYTRIVSKDEKQYLKDHYKLHEKEKAIFQCYSDLLKIMFIAWPEIKSKHATAIPTLDQQYLRLLTLLDDYRKLKKLYGDNVAKVSKTEASKRLIATTEKKFEDLTIKIVDFFNALIAEFKLVKLTTLFSTYHENLQNSIHLNLKDCTKAVEKYARILAEGFAGQFEFNYDPDLMNNKIRGKEFYEQLEQSIAQNLMAPKTANNNCVVNNYASLWNTANNLQTATTGLNDKLADLHLKDDVSEQRTYTS